jgi:hypothetical protein
VAHTKALQLEERLYAAAESAFAVFFSVEAVFFSVEELLEEFAEGFVSLPLVLLLPF